MATASNSEITDLGDRVKALMARIDSTDKELDSKIAALQQKKADVQEVSNPIQYTLFASGLNNGGRNVELKDKNYTNDLAIVFDVVENHSYTRTVDKTSYATEDKVKFSDHGVVEDGKFSFTGRVSSSPTYLIENNYIDQDTDKNNPVLSRRPERALEILEKILEEKQLLTLVTEDKILDSYIMTSLDASRSNSDGAALVFTLEFTQFRTFVLGRTVLSKFSDPKKVKKAKQKGAINSSASGEDLEFYERQTIFQSKIGQGPLQSGLNAMGIDTKSDVVAGVIKPDGSKVLNNGTIIKPGG